MTRSGEARARPPAASGDYAWRPYSFHRGGGGAAEPNSGHAAETLEEHYTTTICIYYADGAGFERAPRAALGTPRQSCRKRRLTD